MEPVATELGVSSPSEIVRAPSRGGTGDRVAWFILGIIPLAVIALAATLSPDPSGHGTHQQLGLPPCGFIYVTGYPCPGCGLTTAFAHMVRLEFVGAARANPFGILLFMVSFTTIFVSAVGFVKKLPTLATLERLQFEKWAVLLSVTAITVWVVRVSTQFLGL
jgi:hypothetical protein